MPVERRRKRVTDPGRRRSYSVTPDTPYGARNPGIKTVATPALERGLRLHVTVRALWPGTHVRPRRHEPETAAGDDGCMVTICTRCRTPYDRRQAGPALPSALSAFCSTCATGAVFLVAGRKPEHA